MSHEDIFFDIEDMKHDELQTLKQLGQRIRYYRRLRKLTQEKLGEQTLVSYKYIGEIERGKKNPSITVIYRLSKILQVSIDNLIDDPSVPICENHKYIQSIIHLLENKDTIALKKAFYLLKVCICDSPEI